MDTHTAIAIGAAAGAAAGVGVAKGVKSLGGAINNINNNIFERGEGPPIPPPGLLEGLLEDNDGAQAEPDAGDAAALRALGDIASNTAGAAGSLANLDHHGSTTGSIQVADHKATNIASKTLTEDKKNTKEVKHSGIFLKGMLKMAEKGSKKLLNSKLWKSTAKQRKRFDDLMDDLVGEYGDYKGQMKGHKHDPLNPKNPSWDSVVPPPLSGQNPPKPKLNIRNIMGGIINTFRKIKSIFESKRDYGDQMDLDDGLWRPLTEILNDQIYEKKKEDSSGQIIPLIKSVFEGFGEKFVMIMDEAAIDIGIPPIPSALDENGNIAKDKEEPKGSSPIRISPGQLHPNQPSTGQIDPSDKLKQGDPFMGRICNL